MAGNYLEQLIAEWYEYQGYYVRRNVLVGKRLKGGYEGELDVVAFNPVTKDLVHIELSMDADSWAEREDRFNKKFEAGREYIPKIFRGLDLPDDIDQRAVFGSASKRNRQTLAGGDLWLIEEVLEEIFKDLRNKKLASNAVPEHLVILRSFQFVNEHQETMMRVWQSAT